MATEEVLITLVVHTEERARKLREILESHGIPVTLEEVRDVDKDILPCAPLKVRIPVAYLPLGLKLLESGELNAEPLELIKMTGMGSTLLIPVDFSPMSMVAVKTGFMLAERFDVEPIVLHCYSGPLFSQGDNSIFSSDLTDNYEPEAEEVAIESSDLRHRASSRLLKFKKEIRSLQKIGALPEIKFSTTLLEGIPEMVIREWCKENRPLMVVMSTRNVGKKGADLVGSVTAEVIDTCRVPVFAVPENYNATGVEMIKRVAMFCTFTGFDALITRWLMHAFDYPSCQLHIMPVCDRPISRVDDKLESLAKYLSKLYPTIETHTSRPARGKFDEHVRDVLEKNDIQLIIVPNRKSTALSRFFRPTLAHKILFEKDIPLLVLPIGKI